MSGHDQDVQMPEGTRPFALTRGGGEILVGVSVKQIKLLTELFEKARIVPKPEGDTTAQASAEQVLLEVLNDALPRIREAVLEELREALLAKGAVEAADEGYECGEAAAEGADDHARMRDALECAWNAATGKDPFHPVALSTSQPEEGERGDPGATRLGWHPVHHAHRERLPVRVKLSLNRGDVVGPITEIADAFYVLDVDGQPYRVLWNEADEVEVMPPDCSTSQEEGRLRQAEAAVEYEAREREPRDVSHLFPGSTSQVGEGGDNGEQVTVEEVRAEAERWAKHHRAEQERVEDLVDRTDCREGDPEVARQHLAVAEAFEDIVAFIDHGPTEAARSEYRVHLKRLKEAHHGRHH